MLFRIPFKVSFSANSTGDFRGRHALCFDNAVREHRGVMSSKKVKKPILNVAICDAKFVNIVSQIIGFRSPKFIS